jgi:hypothetical protein
VVAATASQADQPDDDLVLYRVKDAMVQQGRARLIPAGAIRDYIQLLKNEARQEARQE